MDDSRLTNINRIKEFLKGSRGVELSVEDFAIEEKYAFIDHTVDRLHYSKLSQKDKRVVRNYLKKITGYKKAQLFRLIKKARRGTLKRKEYTRKNPNRKYQVYDVKLLEETDEVHLRLNASATKEILRREYEVFGREKFENLSEISVSHIDNLRRSLVYRSGWVNHTRPRQVPIGETKKPENHGEPGSVRVDTVHQRDVYHINFVDEVTQWELVICVPRITEKYLEPALYEMEEQFPFVLSNFHSDRGGEFINYNVARILHKLLIQQTKNRSYHCNDNALVETKNGSVIRKNMGWWHINKGMAGKINSYYRNYFNTYLNYHRPCRYSTKTKIYSGGRKRKIYDQTMVPYDKLKLVGKQKKKSFLKPGITFEELDKIAYQCSDNQFATIMRKQERPLFDKILKEDINYGSR